MNFFTTLSEKLGFKPKENDEEREEDELEDDEEQDDEDEEEDEERPSRFSLNNPFGKTKKQASSSRRRAVVAENDEEDEEEEPPVRRQTRHNNVIHDSRMDPRAAEELQYTHCERIVNVRQTSIYLYRPSYQAVFSTDNRDIFLSGNHQISAARRKRFAQFGEYRSQGLRTSGGFAQRRSFCASGAYA